MYFYTAYGLGIQSEFEIPEFAQAGTKVDVYVKRGQQYTVPPDFANQWTGIKVDDDHVQFFVNGHGLFCIDNAREITLHTAPGADENLLRRFLIGTVMALVMHRQGALVLHGSAVQIAGKAVIFLGQSGRGKSSVAAAMLARGHSLISDDVIAVTFAEDTIKIVPAYPELKVDPKVAKTLSLDAKHLYSVFDGTELGYRNLNQFAHKPVTPDKIFVLAVVGHQSVEIIPVQERVIELISNSYVRRKSEGDTHLIQCARLSNLVPVQRLCRDQSLTNLPKLAQLVENFLLDNNLDKSAKNSQPMNLKV